MSCLGNLIWFFLAGLWTGLAWVLTGILWCITIVGIPVGLQCFKLARLSFFPFGKTVVANGKASSFLLNILWIIFGGIELAVVHVATGLLLCITIIGIPFGLQSFKLARLALMPFGAQIAHTRKNNNPLEVQYR